ncbi:MAG: aminotransferase class V-fold PLP-dependent enzyme [Gemmatimonadota bacterium]|nr:aminotransferase class V-fold PLP-dependent enzyme [Gemmatimonadota bacterium]
MKTRREFLGSVSAAAAIAALPRGSSALGSIAEWSGDPLGVRPDFPVVDEGIYLDGAYITPSPRQAVEAAQAFLARKASQPVSLGDMLAETNEARSKFARIVGASAPEVGMLFATSDGENIITRALDFAPGDNVVIDDLHYETTFILYRQLAESAGLEVRTVRNVDGEAPVEAFAELVDDRTRLISVAWVSHQNGYRHDLRGLADLAHAHGAYLYADAIQGMGMLDLDVKDVGIDFLTSGTYKWLLGGYGVAPFYVREELLDAVGVDRWGSLQIEQDLGEHRYRLYEDGRKYGYATLGFGAVYQLSAALDYLLGVGVPNVEAHTVGLARRLRDGLAAQGHRVLTPDGNRSAIVTFEHGQSVSRARADLEDADIRVSLKEGGEQIRVGVALFNIQEEIDALLGLTSSWV